jgi:hypothetical protein
VAGHDADVDAANVKRLGHGGDDRVVGGAVHGLGMDGNDEGMFVTVGPADPGS